MQCRRSQGIVTICLLVIVAAHVRAQEAAIPRVVQPPRPHGIPTPVLDAARRRIVEHRGTIERENPAREGVRSERDSGVRRVNVPPPADTEGRVWLRLEHPVDTRTARAGDPVFLRTAFPVSIDGTSIPEGTAAIGRIVRARRAGRFRGRAALEIGVLSIRAADGTEIATGTWTSFEQAPGVPRSALERDFRVRLATGIGLAGGYGVAALASRWSDSAETIARAGLAGAVGVGTLVVLMERGEDVRLPPGTVVEVTGRASPRARR